MTTTAYGRLETSLRERRELGVKSLVVYLTGGLPGWLDMVRAAADAGAGASALPSSPLRRAQAEACAPPSAWSRRT